MHNLEGGPSPALVFSKTNIQFLVPRNRSVFRFKILFKTQIQGHIIRTGKDIPIIIIIIISDIFVCSYVCVAFMNEAQPFRRNRQEELYYGYVVGCN